MPPLILLGNDDGVDAAGITALAAALAPLGEIVIVAPTRQRSGASHAITIDRPLRVFEVGERVYAVDGTPVDTMFVALHKLLPRPPQLLISGINHGCNIGRDIFYSGTVAVAMEGAIKGIQALALSQQLLPGEDGVRTSPAQAALFQAAARFAASLAAELLATPLPPATMLNVNFPARRTAEYRWTHADDHVYGAEIVDRVDPRGNPYYWIGGPAEVAADGAPGSDARAIHEGAISVTSLAPDFNSGWPRGWARPAARGFSLPPELAHDGSDERRA